MTSFHESMAEYKRQLHKGIIQQAYRGLMDYLMGLRTYFEKKYPDYFVSGSLYYGTMDMTYFAFTPPSLQQRKLKIAIVFLHETGRFEAWLGAYNKQVQARYWKLIKESGWAKHPVVPTLKGMDSIIEHVLVDEPDFSHLDEVTEQIERATMCFVVDVEGFLSTTVA